MIDEVALWQRLVALLPPEDAAEVLDYCGIGEQECALDYLVSSLLRHQVTISETTRAEIAVMAEDWGMWTALADRITQCRGSDDTEVSLRLTEDAESAPLPGTSLPRNAALSELFLTPWVICARCGQVLARAHANGLSCLTQHYVLLAAERKVNEGTFGSDAVWDAVAALRTSCDRL